MGAKRETKLIDAWSHLRVDRGLVMGPVHLTLCKNHSEVVRLRELSRHLLGPVCQTLSGAAGRGPDV